jgi:hypothetical protein
VKRSTTTSPAVTFEGKEIVSEHVVKHSTELRFFCTILESAAAKRPPICGRYPMKATPMSNASKVNEVIIRRFPDFERYIFANERSSESIYRFQFCNYDFTELRETNQDETEVLLSVARIWLGDCSRVSLASGSKTRVNRSRAAVSTRV